MSVLYDSFLSQPEFRRAKTITYAWDQWRYTDYFYFTAPEILGRAGKLTGTGCKALCIGLGEWISARLTVSPRIDDARQYFDAAWATMLVPDSCDYAELSHDDWAGPVDGVLRAAMLIVNDTIFEAEEDRQFADRVCWQIHLAQYIADDSDGSGLADWLAFAWTELERRHSGPVISYDSIFDPHFTFGLPVSPFELVPGAASLDRSAERDLVEHVNRQIGRNRYLRIRHPLSAS